ncbi:hypothetical protein FLL45_18595 [Aliikangiella marina]|uniref:Uncharacterized protein n=1 Tax=Aliikangiella marina TaxID=1712262 RepID=A0A545T4Z0_9GAMM|nr:hypothetical protein [Aliikangiella marina]TQV72228.1 hypothetical protein FLL45_18595 [Aliikangiella marina]
MHSHKVRQLMPGKYQFRPNPFEPWVNVRVYQEHEEDPKSLKASWDGKAIDVEKIAQHGEWQPLFDD